MSIFRTALHLKTDTAGTTIESMEWEDKILTRMMRCLEMLCKYWMNVVIKGIEKSREGAGSDQTVKTAAKRNRVNWCWCLCGWKQIEAISYSKANLCQYPDRKKNPDSLAAEKQQINFCQKWCCLQAKYADYRTMRFLFFLPCFAMKYVMIVPYSEKFYFFLG